MAKQAISVTLDADNVIWLRGRAGATGLRSVSELLDRLVTAARTSGSTGLVRSVVGTIDIDAADPLLDGADTALKRIFDASMRRPATVREKPPKYGSRTAAPGKRRG